MPWKGLLPSSWCNLRSKYRNHVSRVAKGTQEKKILALSENVLPCDQRLTNHEESTDNLLFSWEFVFLKHMLSDIMSRTSGSGFVPWTESACKGDSNMKLPLLDMLYKWFSSAYKMNLIFMQMCTQSTLLFSKAKIVQGRNIQYW